MVDKVAASDSTVLLVGESGTGKELFAEAIHLRSARKDGPLVKVNCAAFVETLLLSELFGHEKGAFTGALSRKKGRFEMAQGGTIFLDEIGDISPNTQVALLRVLQEREIERVGGGGAVSIDVRVIAATNRNLEEMVRQGSFRLDLYYRLKGVVLELPPLRERRADIPRLVRHFAEREAEGQGRARYFSYDALRLLASYNWPGNIRELENFVRSMLLFVDDEVIQEEHIREFDEFFAEGEMAGEVPRIWFEAGWWSPPKPPSVAAPEEPAPAQDEVSLSRALLALSGSAVPVRPQAEALVVPLVAPPAPSAPAELGPAEPVVVGAEESDEEDEGAWREMPLGGLEQALIHRVVDEGVSLQDLKKRLELECIKQALLSTEGNITHAASVLKMKRPRLSQIINAHPELEEVRRKFG
jgi:transcriptional regulator with GAF, ATPase, and Fis domain